MLHLQSFLTQLADMADIFRSNTNHLFEAEEKEGLRSLPTEWNGLATMYASEGIYPADTRDVPVADRYCPEPHHGHSDRGDYDFSAIDAAGRMVWNEF